jgi:hypothetical protein
MTDDLPTTASIRQRINAGLVVAIFTTYSIGPLIVLIAR